jgi:hypothetical protein
MFCFCAENKENNFGTRIVILFADRKFLTNKRKARKMENILYCTQTNTAGCNQCSLVSYGRDCHNNKITNPDYQIYQNKILEFCQKYQGAKTKDMLSTSVSLQLGNEYNDRDDLFLLQQIKSTVVAAYAAENKY